MRRSARSDAAYSRLQLRVLALQVRVVVSRLDLNLAALGVQRHAVLGHVLAHLWGDGEVVDWHFAWRCWLGHPARLNSAFNRQLLCADLCAVLLAELVQEVGHDLVVEALHAFTTNMQVVALKDMNTILFRRGQQFLRQLFAYQLGHALR